jgi:hypothetical protein
MRAGFLRILEFVERIKIRKDRDFGEVQRKYDG